MASATNLADLRAKARQDLDKRKSTIAVMVDKRDSAAFKSMLVDTLANAPSINWRALAKRDPFKYIQCMEKLAVMSGYVFDGMQSGPTVLVVEGMSDTSLVQALAAARAKTMSLPLTIDAEPCPEPVPTPVPTPESDIYKVARIVPASESVSQATIMPASDPAAEASSVPAFSERAGGTGSEAE